MLNAVAGGGSFLTFPALVFAGVPPVNANATSTVALWPGTVASAGAYRDEFDTQRRTPLLLGGVSVIGGVVGAALLLRTLQATFSQLVPWLLLLATVLFAFGGAATKWLRARLGHGAGSSWRATAGVAALQFVVAVYGGYFGGGIGIVMLALLVLLGMEKLHTMNALKTILASCINGVAVLTFILAGAVAWSAAIVMIVGAIVGGYGAAYFARRLDQRLIRPFVIVVGLSMTAYFFLRA